MEYIWVIGFENSLKRLCVKVCLRREHVGDFLYFRIVMSFQKFIWENFLYESILKSHLFFFQSRRQNVLNSIFYLKNNDKVMTHDMHIGNKRLQSMLKNSVFVVSVVYLVVSYDNLKVLCTFCSLEHVALKVVWFQRSKN